MKPYRMCLTAVALTASIVIAAFITIHSRRIGTKGPARGESSGNRIASTDREAQAELNAKSDNSLYPQRNHSKKLTRSQPAPSLLFAHAPTPVPQSQDANKEFEGDDHAQKREDWFIFQRTYPFGDLPPDGRRQAWESRLRLKSRAKIDANQPVGTWQPIGPAPTFASLYSNWGLTSGRINAIAVSPANPQIVLVGAATGGVWRSTDGGGSFAPMTDNQVDLSVGSITFAKSNSQIVYAGMGDPHNYLGSGVLKSTDAGLTWVRVSNSSLPAPGSIYKVEVDPTNPNNVYVAQFSEKSSSGTVFSSGFFRSTDGGVNWSRTLSGLPKDLVVHPSTPTTLYLAMSRVDGSGNLHAGLYKSIDAGLTWQISYTTPYDSTSDIKVAVTPAAPDTVYVYTGGSLNNSFDTRVAVSTDAGANWTTLGAAGVDKAQFEYNTYIAVDPNNAGAIYLGTRDIYRSTDGGSSYTNLTGNFDPASGNYHPDQSDTHPDQHTFAFAPGSSSVIYAGNDGGISKSTDGGKSFQSLNGTLSLTQFTSIALHPTDPNYTYGGAQDNGNQRHDIGSTQWHELISGDGGDCVIDPVDTSIVFMSYVNGTIWRFTDKGDTFDAALGGRASAFNNDRIGFYPPIVGNGIDQRLYVGTYRLYVSNDLGNTWTPPAGALDLTKGAGGSDVLSAITVSHANTNVIYTGSAQGRAMVSTTGGATWTDITTGLPNRFIKSITVDPRDPNVAYLTVSGYASGHIFKTINAGAAWSDISSNLPDIPTNSFTIDPLDLRVFYVGTDIGVFRSTDSGQTWASFEDGMPPAVVSAFASQSTGLIQLATYGRGAYTLNRTVSLSDPADLQVSIQAQPVPAVAGQPLTYAITATNKGPGAASNVVVVDNLPAGTTFVSATSNSGTCSGAGPVTCQLGVLGITGSATVNVTVMPTGTGMIANTVTVRADNADPVSLNNTAAITTQVLTASADLAVTLISSPDGQPANAPLTYTATVTNNGPTGASNVTLADILPVGASLVAATSSQGTCSGASTVACSFGNLGVGSSVQVTITIIPGSQGSVSNTVTVGTTDPDPVSSNNTATKIVQVAAPVAASFSFTDFSSVANLSLVGSAARSGARLRLTPNVGGLAGAAYHLVKQPVQVSFDTAFQFVVDSQGGTPADGFAFIIQNSSPLALGSSGSGMGYDGIANSLAIEFDTFQGVDDPNSNHISVQTRGTLANSSDETFSLGQTTNIPLIANGQTHTIKLSYTPGNLNIFFDNLTSPVLTVNVDLSATLNLDNGTAYLGFTAATGGFSEIHDILNWSYSTRANNPTPGIASISPQSTAIGSAGFTLTVNGSNFLNGATVRLNGQNRATTFISATQLQAAIPASDLASAGSVAITVLNPAPSSESASQSFTISKGQPLITWAKPASIVFDTPLGNAQLNATVSYNGATLPGNLSYSPAAGAILGGGLNQTLTVTFTPTDASNYTTATKSVSIDVTKAGQTITFGPLSDHLPTDPPFDISATASSKLPVTFTASGSVTVSGTKLSIIGPGLATITASQPGDNNFSAATSVVQTFTVKNGVPAAFGLNPSVTFAGASGFTLNVTGANFVSGAVVRWNGLDRATTFVNSSTLQATIPATDLLGAGAAAVTVFNPAPGGGLSGQRMFQIVAVTSFDTRDAAAGATVTASTQTTQPVGTGVTAALTRPANSSGNATLTVKTYAANPTIGGIFDAGGGYTDIKVSNSSATDSLLAKFYYPVSITGATEGGLKLLYFNGSTWAVVRGSGNSSPVKSTTDNLDGTTSGGRFTVTFDSTSTPKLSDMTGTVFTATTIMYGDLNNDQTIDASDLVLLANALAGNVQLTTPAADVFQDGVVNAADLVTLANFLAGNISTLPVLPASQAVPLSVRIKR